MRKEADDTGPIAELEHWRQRRAKFNTLLDQMKSKQCKTVIGVLMHAKSKVLKVSSNINAICLSTLLLFTLYILLIC